MFKKKYKLSFQKDWNSTNGIVTDSFLIQTTIQAITEFSNNLEIRKVSLRNLGTCSIVIAGDRNDYLHFIKIFLEKTGKFIGNIKF